MTGQPSAMSGGEMMDDAGQDQHADCECCVCRDRATFSDARW